MIVDIDLNGAPPVVQLLDASDCKRFHVAVRGGDAAALGAFLEAQKLGRLEPRGDVMIAIAAVRRMAEGSAPAGWDDDFTAMLQYAGTKGWLDSDGSMIQAHVERSD